MILIDEREAATPGWQWAGYRTWRVSNVDRESRSAWTSELGHRYRVTKVVPMRIDRRQLRLA